MALTVGTLGRVVFVPILNAGRLLSKHPLPRARGVDQDPVKKGRKLLFQLVGAFVGHHHVLSPPPLQVFGQDLGPVLKDFVGDQKALVVHLSDQVS